MKVIVALNFEWIFPKHLIGMDYLMLGCNLVVESVIDLKSAKKCCLAVIYYYKQFHNQVRVSVVLLGVVPQNDLSSAIIISRCYNDLNFFL